MKKHRMIKILGLGIRESKRQIRANFAHNTWNDGNDTCIMEYVFIHALAGIEFKVISSIAWFWKIQRDDSDTSYTDAIRMDC